MQLMDDREPPPPGDQPAIEGKGGSESATASRSAMPARITETNVKE
jgi:hypothetical protein